MTWEEFEASLRAPVPRTKRVWYWFYRNFTLRSLVWKMKQPVYWYQRARYGVATPDTWALDHYLSGVIERGVRQLAQSPHAGPPLSLDKHYGGQADVAWSIVLSSIADGFAAYRSNTFNTDMIQRREVGMELFALYFTDLWD